MLCLKDNKSPSIMRGWQFLWKSW